MSRSKYTPDITKGIALSANDHRPMPAELPGLGAKALCAFSRCADCGPDAHPSRAGTFTTYGSTPLCRHHAIQRAFACTAAPAAER